MLSRHALRRVMTQAATRLTNRPPVFTIRASSVNTISKYESIRPELLPTSEPTVLPPLPAFPIPRVGGQDPFELSVALAKWVVNNGGKLHDSFFIGSLTQLAKPGASDDGNWGGVATGPIKKDEVIASIPVKLCLFPMERPPAAGYQDTFFQGVAGLISYVKPASWQVRLGIRLLAERARDSSYFAPYINALPAHFPSVPLFYSKEAASATQYHGLFDELSLRSATIHSLTKLATPPEDAQNDPEKAKTLPPAVKYAAAAFNGFTVSPADLSWATSAVSSRAFQAPIKASENARTVQGDVGGADEKCLIPLVDMLNHSYHNNARIVFSRDVSDRAAADKLGRDAYTVLIRATRDIEAGEEITINYFRPQDKTAVAAFNPTDVFPSAANEHALADAINSASTLKEVFRAGLARARGAAEFPLGLYSEVSNDDVVMNFGYVPPFNVRDDLRLPLDQDMLDLALEMAHDYTYPHAYLAQAPEELLYRTELVMPLPKVNNHRDGLLQSVLQQAKHAKLTWLGPNDALMAVLRAAVIGAHRPNTDASSSDAHTKDSEYSAAVVQSEVDAATHRDMFALEERARAVLATRGIVVADDDFVDQNVVAEMCFSFISKENEEAAAWLLYCLCIMTSGTFEHKLSKDAILLTQAIRAKDAGAYTAMMYGHEKKQLLSHAMQLLATRLRTDRIPGHVWHKNME